jgi:flagellar protein FliS
MFSPAPSAGRGHRTANFYHQVGVETGVANATPHQLTLMLFDGFLGALKKAKGAMAARRIEDKCNHIRHAARIIDEGLKSALDVNRGGEIARNLRDLYDYVQVRLLHANLRNDEAALDEVIKLLTPLRDAWAEIGDRVPS